MLELDCCFENACLLQARTGGVALATVYTQYSLFSLEVDCRVMLSDKLLSKTDYTCDREIRTLELLKLRFGDANLHNCEVCCTVAFSSHCRFMVCYLGPKRLALL